MALAKGISFKTQNIFIYGALMAALVFVLKWLQWKFVVADNQLDVYVGLVAILFTALGVWISMQVAKPKTVIVEKEIYISQPGNFEVSHAELQKLNLSSREYEVLQLLAKGSSNAEIADSLYLSLSTIKTHASNLFVKMDVKSRAKAIEKAKRLKIIA